MKEQLVQLYARLQLLSPGTLLTIIEELGLEDNIPDNEYKEMAESVLGWAKAGGKLTDRQKRVLVNIIGQPREGNW